MALWIFDSERLFRIAASAADSARKNPVGAGDQATIAILFSAAAVEGWVNEIATWAEIDVSGRNDSIVESLSAVLTEAEENRASLTLKVQLACALGSGSLLERGASAYQNLSTLISLRNAIVHLKPERYGAEAEPIHPLLKKLKSRGLLEGPIEAELFAGSWLDKLATPAIAAWAYAAAVEVVEEVVARMPDDPFKVRLKKYTAGIAKPLKDRSTSAAVDA